MLSEQELALLVKVHLECWAIQFWRACAAAFAVVLHDYNVKLPETSQLHVLWRKCCIVFLLLTFYFSMALIFTMVGFSTSHFLTTAIKVSCYSSNVISLLCLLSFTPVLSVISVENKIKSKERIGFVVVVVLSLN